MFSTDPCFFNPWNLDLRNDVGTSPKSFDLKLSNSSELSKKSTATMTQRSTRGSKTMEKLQRRSDGFAETQSGNLGVFPLRSSGKDTEHKWFDFKRTAVSDTVRVRWRIDDKIIVVEAATALYLFRKGYARHVTDAEVLAWNETIDDLDLDAPSPAPIPIEETPEPETVPADEKPAQEQAKDVPAEPAEAAPPATGQTAPEGQENAPETPAEPVVGAGEPAEADADAEENTGSKKGRKAKEKTEEKGLL